MTTRPAFTLLVTIGFMLAGNCVGRTEAPLTSIESIHSLTAEEADQMYLAEIEGVVTRCTPAELYVQTGNFAIFILPSQGRLLYSLGDYIRVVGKTGPGHFLPIVTEEHSVLVRRGALPTPIPTTYTGLAAGKMDCRFVAVEGLLRRVEQISEVEWRYQLAMREGILRVDVSGNPSDVPRAIGSRLRLHGVAAGLKNENRQIVLPLLLVQNVGDNITVLSPSPDTLSTLSTQPIASLLSSTDFTNSGPMAKVRGQVIWTASPDHAYVKDPTDTIEVHLQSPASWKAGDIVEIAGFPEPGLIKPRIMDGIARVLHPEEKPRPWSTDAKSLLLRTSEADLVKVEGTVPWWLRPCATAIASWKAKNDFPDFGAPASTTWSPSRMRLSISHADSGSSEGLRSCWTVRISMCGGFFSLIGHHDRAGPRVAASTQLR